MRSPALTPAAHGDLARRPTGIPFVAWVAIAASLPLIAEWLGWPPLLMVPAVVGVAAIGGALLAWPLQTAAWLPALFPPPQFAKTFAYEVALLVVTGIILLAALRERRNWIWRLHPAQVAAVTLALWATATFFWVRDPWWWAFGVRKLGIGVIAFVAAGIVARLLPRDRGLLGILGGAMSLALATFVHAIQHSGGGARNTSLRVQATDLGWGTSNYIAALLILMLPTVLLIAMHATRARWRALAWVTLPLMALVMALGASRGGSLLLVLVTLGAAVRERSSPRTWIVLGVIAASIAVLLAGPLGTQLLARFVEPRELGSIVVRLIFFREGWRRLVANFPLGIGQGQGYGYPDHLNTEDPHNYLLVVGGELGLVGLVLWTVVLVLLWQASGRILRQPGGRPRGEALRATLIFSQINSLFEPTFQGLQYHFLFYWICGIYLGGFDAPTFGLPGRRSSAATSAGATNPVIA